MTTEATTNIDQSVALVQAETNETEIQKSQPKTPMALSEGGIILTSFDELWRFSCAVVKSGLAKKGDTNEAVMIKIQMGMELGLPAMSSIQNIAVINGTPSVYGDAAKALVLASPLCEYIVETHEGVGEQAIYKCTSKRRGEHNVELVTTFSVDDAKLAKLWGKVGPWTDYPSRMLMFRARSFNIRDNFPDVLKGIALTEEVQDYSTISRKTGNHAKANGTIKPEGNEPA